MKGSGTCERGTVVSDGFDECMRCGGGHFGRRAHLILVEALVRKILAPLGVAAVPPRHVGLSYDGWRGGRSSRLMGTRSGDSRLTGAAPLGVAETAAEGTEVALQLRLRLLPRRVLIVRALATNDAEAFEKAAHQATAALEASSMLGELGAHDVACRVREPLGRALATASTALLELGEDDLLH